MFSHLVDKAYQSFWKSIFFTSQIDFDIALTDVEATLKQLWDNATSSLKHRRNNVVQCLKAIVSTLCNVDSTLFQGRTPTLYRLVQRWKSDVGFCFIFNVGSTLFERWSTALKQHWSGNEMVARKLIGEDRLTFKEMFWMSVEDFKPVLKHISDLISLL